MPRDSAARAADRQVRAASGPKGTEPSANASITPDSGQAMVDLDFVRGLIEAVDQSSVDSLEISRFDTRIRISKSPPPARILSNGVGAAPPPAAHAPLVAAPAVPAPVVPPPVEEKPRTNLVDVKSPMVGTFYRAPAPEAPPYVEVGNPVRKGQTLCILEAMKLMNELDSEVDGIVREVLAENTEPVEYGQVLFRIEPSGSA
jgi:acetyl-CoA carboxylase biotin carboxyl carrier protein